MRRRRRDPEALRDAAALLPIAAAVLLLPPFILLFAAPVRIGGVPLIVAYVFGAWAVVILLAWVLARAHDGAAGEDGRTAARRTEHDADRR